MSKIFVANWKMNKTNAEVREYIKSFKKLIKKDMNEIYICAPYTSLETLVKETKKSRITPVAQNVHYETNGAFTGEISIQMLKEIRVKTVLIGHCERRVYFGETNELINKKVLACKQNELKVILCVGENEEEYSIGKTKNILCSQLKEALKGVSNLENILIAYEPVWSISTFSKGATATDADIKKAHKIIYDQLSKLYPNELDNIKILYGGSVNIKNAENIMKIEYVEGALVGGASLTPEKFIDCVNAGNKV